jgi:uncharacterized small protein (DUF1192 family)
MSQARVPSEEVYRPEEPAPLQLDSSMETESEVAKLRAEIERLRAKQAEVMELLGCKNPDKLVHDLRNILNEMQLLRLLAKMDA